MAKNRFHVGMVVFCAALSSVQALAWAERGHHVICEVASRLVEEPGLKKFLLSRQHQLGHVCNIPDIYWRDIRPQNPIADATHFMNPENYNWSAAEVPTSLAEISRLTGDTPDVIAAKLGTLWWRADELFREASGAVAAAKAATPPTGAQAQDNANPYNAAVYKFLVSLGAFGHFVGDSTMPYHNTKDYDGWGRNRGGIHSYYESASVNALGLDLVEAVFQKAAAARRRELREMQQQQASAPSVDTRPIVEIMRESSAIAMSEISEIERLDNVLEPSTMVTQPTGEVVKTTAKRPPADVQARVFRPVITKELSRAALLLARLWDRAYREGGMANLDAYRSYRYPLSPDFVELDYLRL